MTVTDLNAQFGSFYRKEGQSIRDIHPSFFQPLVTEGFFGGLIPTEETQIRKAKAIIGRILRAKQKAFTGDDTAELLPRFMNLQELSYEYECYPDQVQESWAAFLTNKDTNDRRMWPLPKYIVDVLMINKGREEYELNEVYKGVKAAIVPGTPNPVGENFDGIEKQMDDAITATDLVPIPGPAAWSTDPVTFVGEVRAWIEDVRASSTEARLLLKSNQIRRIGMAPELLERLAEGIFEKYNVNYNVTGDGIMQETTRVRLPFSGGLAAEGLPSMIGKERIFMTPEENKACYIKRPKSETGPEVQPFERTLKIFMDYFKAIGFWHWEYVYTTDHEYVAPGP